MVEKKRSTSWRVWHRWLSLIFGLQMVLWTISGAYMVFFKLHFIHGNHLIQDISEPLPEHTKLVDLNQLLMQYPGTNSATLETRWIDNELRAVYKVSNNTEAFLVDAQSLQPIELKENNILELANRYYALGEPDVESVVYITENPPSEISEKLLPIWQVNYNDFGSTSLYISESTGDLMVKRHTFWRGFDMFWMLHIMDYDERVDIETWWLKAFIIGTFILMITGIVLLVYTISFRRKSVGGSQ